MLIPTLVAAVLIIQPMPLESFIQTILVELLRLSREALLNYCLETIGLNAPMTAASIYTSQAAPVPLAHPALEVYVTESWITRRSTRDLARHCTEYNHRMQLASRALRSHLLMSLTRSFSISTETARRASRPPRLRPLPL